MNDGMLELLREQGVLSPLDEHLARTLGRLGGEERSEVLLAAALTSRHVSSGHACLDIGRLVETPLLVDQDGDPVPGPAWPNVTRWLVALHSSPLVSAGDATTPLVLDRSGRLYLRRYWQHELGLAAAIRQRVAEVDVDLDPATLRDGLDRMFPTAGDRTGDGGEPDWQRVAAAMAAQRKFCVISGGPGTGKTFTVTKIMALLVEQAMHAGRPLPRITLVAPTGKAAMRLGELMRRAKSGLNCPDSVKRAIPDEAATIHRCLGAQHGSLTRFLHSRDNPLHTDVVLVDEASMVDLALMSRLLQAMPRHARLILLGDMDQLASVEAGAVLGDICDTGQVHSHSRALARWLRDVSGDTIPISASAPDETGIWDCIVYLTRSYRYQTTSGIGRLARAINAGDAAAACAVLEEGEAVGRCAPIRGAADRRFRDAVVHGFQPFCVAGDAVSQLRELERFRVLCAHRKGPWGFETMNREIELTLEEAGLVHRVGRAVRTQPIIVTQNNYQIGLFNGDVGVIAVDRTADSQRTAYFLDADGQQRRLSPSRLPPHEPVYAMSIHKSQGSEFDAVVVLLPEELSPVISRELLYTAVTRAREQVTIYATHAAIERAISRRIERSSGLRDALWNG